MYTFLKLSGPAKFIATEAPSLFIALILSELLYKFGSFMMEGIAFLVTWYCISFVHNSIRPYKQKKQSSHPS